jgi:hypothetical protein
MTDVYCVEYLDSKGEAWPLSNLPTLDRAFIFVQDMIHDRTYQQRIGEWAYTFGRGVWNAPVLESNPERDAVAWRISQRPNNEE